MGRLPVALALLSCLPAVSIADTIVDGVGYTWNYSPITNYSGMITATFSAPVSSYTFSVEFPNGAVNPQVWVASQYAPTITWSTTTGGQWVSSTENATVSGRLANVTQMEATVAVGTSSVMLGPFPGNFHFTSLVDPPVGIQETPEPATQWLVCAGLALTTLMCKTGRTKQSRHLTRM